MIVFLDMDGVLTHGDHVQGLGIEGEKTPMVTSLAPLDLRCVNQLIYLYRFVPYSIVISSTWRKLLSPKAIELKLQNDSDSRVPPVIGATPITTEYGVWSDRVAEIRQWVHDHQYDPEKTIVIDDDSNIREYTEGYVVHVDQGWDNGGLQQRHIDDFLERIRVVDIDDDF